MGCGVPFLTLEGFESWEGRTAHAGLVCSFGGGQTLVSVLCVVLEEGLKTVCTNCKGLSRCGVWGSLSHP